jgi:predicted phage terminase large subunit-like protein
MKINDQKQQIKDKAIEDFVFFCRLINPHRVYGQCHEDVMRWMTNPLAGNNQLVLLPRGHMKSHIAAMWAAWWITKNPAVTIIYVSATERLAILQLSAIKQVLESPQYRRYWPEMIHPEEGKRRKWAASEIIVDHPARRAVMERDYTVLATSLGANTTGLHSDVLIFDDMVVPDNAYTGVGREDVELTYSMFSSVLNPGGISKAVGTLYHPDDIYHKMREEEAEDYNEEGDMTGTYKVWEVYDAEVETDGRFLWPREQHPISKDWYGFNLKILAEVKAKYKNKAHFFAQYYNKTNDPTANRVGREKFQYYDEKYLTVIQGAWHFKGKRLLIFAAMDVAWTVGNSSDYTAIAVIGIDSEGFIYVLELDRFKTSDFLVYYEAIRRLHAKWAFRKIRIETNAGGKFVEQEVKKYIRQNGDSICVEGKNKVTHDLKKAERIATTLEPRYNNGDVWHPKGGLITALEEEIMLERPKHDDLKDALCTAVEISVVPAARTNTGGNVVPLRTHSRFGGIRR